MTDEYRLFGKEVVFGTNSGTPIPAFSFWSYSGDVVTGTTVRFHSPRVWWAAVFGKYLSQC